MAILKLATALNRRWWGKPKSSLSAKVVNSPRHAISSGRSTIISNVDPDLISSPVKDPMLFFPEIRPNPIRMLLYTEWLMIASCGSLAIVELFHNHRSPTQHIAILMALGVMGWICPIGSNSWVKVLYTALEIGLIFYGTTLGYLHILPTLYLIVVIRSCFIFNAVGRWVSAVLALLLFFIHKVGYPIDLTGQTTAALLRSEPHRFWMHQLSEILMFAVGLFLALQFVSTWLSERSTREQLASAHERLRTYALQIEDLAAVRERNRIARDIHDSLGHALTALNVQLQTATKLWEIDPKQAQPFLIQAKRLGGIAIQEVRQSVQALRIDGTEAEPLESAIASLVKDFHQGTGIAVSTHIDLGKPLPADVIKTLYRLVQEALTNICKHAQASQVMLQLETMNDRVCLLLTDNGQGFDVDLDRPGFGLQGMQERVTELRGVFHLTSQAGSGCQIQVELPLNPVETRVSV